MKIDFQVMEALEMLESERGIPVVVILDALANALVSAYKRSPGAAEEARVTIDADGGDIFVYAQELDEEGNVIKEWEDTPDDFGRIAATTAKQVISQRLREAKREQVFDVYEGRDGDLVTGLVQQHDNRYTILDLGNAEAMMPGSERIPYERLERNARVKALILEVRREAKGPQIVVSRSHPDFVRRLMELEVPELLDGTIEIRAIAREAGHRTKIAVSSNDSNVDPKGACVGARGSRVRQVVNELRGEKVDVVQWREDLQQFIAEALGPAKVREVQIDEEEKAAIVIVSEHQLSLAIGKEGQNARLAARLTGYRVDIRSDQPPVEEEPEVETSPEIESNPEALPAEEDAATETEVVADDAEPNAATAQGSTAEDSTVEIFEEAPEAHADEAPAVEDTAVEDAAVDAAADDDSADDDRANDDTAAEAVDEDAADEDAADETSEEEETA
jgi:N utilization substance protein A